MVRFDFKILKNCRIISIFSFILLVLFLIGCSQNQDNAGQTDITSSVIEEPLENCRFSDQSDCSPIEITRVEPAEEEEIGDEIFVAESMNITDKPVYNITLQNLTSLSLACEAGWKCIKGSHIAYQEANCSWHSIEKCIYGCNENESMCRLAPICKVKSLKCENDNLMICGEEGYKWLLNESCDEDCEDEECTNSTSGGSGSSGEGQQQANCSSCIKFKLDESNITGSLNCNAGQYNEYVTFKNECTNSCSLTGWIVKDATTKKMAFAEFTLTQGFVVRIRTGNSTNTTSDIFWNRCSAVWNNDEDTVHLFDNNGNLIINESYSLS